MANRQNSGGRVTKAERREQARRERLELQRKLSRAKRNRRIALVLVVLVAAGGTAYALTRPSGEGPDPDALLAQAAQAEQTAGCSEVEDVGPYVPETQDQAHVSSAEFPDLSGYPSVPPASGPHNQVPLGGGTYEDPPPIDQLIHSLEHGAVAVWYAPDASGPELQRLQEFFDGSQGDRVIVAPYDYPAEGEAGSLPTGTEMALVSWHHVERCAQVNLAAAFAFVADYGFPTYDDREYLGDAPEPGAAI